MKISTVLLRSWLLSIVLCKDQVDSKKLSKVWRCLNCSPERLGMIKFKENMKSFLFKVAKSIKIWFSMNRDWYWQIDAMAYCEGGVTSPLSHHFISLFPTVMKRNGIRKTKNFIRSVNHVNLVSQRQQKFILLVKIW